jgi:hypothetical protein
MIPLSFAKYAKFAKKARYAKKAKYATAGLPPVPAGGL